jgi:hypothetical protein
MADLIAAYDAASRDFQRTDEEADLPAHQAAENLLSDTFRAVITAHPTSPAEMAAHLRWMLAEGDLIREEEIQRSLASIADELDRVASGAEEATRIAAKLEAVIEKCGLCDGPDPYEATIFVAISDVIAYLRRPLERGLTSKDSCTTGRESADQILAMVEECEAAAVAHAEMDDLPGHDAVALAAAKDRADSAYNALMAARPIEPAAMAALLRWLILQQDCGQADGDEDRQVLEHIAAQLERQAKLDQQAG